MFFGRLPACTRLRDVCVQDGGQLAANSAIVCKTERRFNLTCDIRLHAIFFTVGEAVKLPVMWKLWSREDVNKL